MDAAMSKNNDSEQKVLFTCSQPNPDTTPSIYNPGKHRKRGNPESPENLPVLEALSSPEVLDTIIPVLKQKLSEALSPITEAEVKNCVEEQIKPLSEKIISQEKLTANNNQNICKLFIQVHRLEQCCKDRIEQIKDQDKELDSQYNKIKDLETRIENQEQYSSRTSVRFHNVPVPVNGQGKILHPVNTDHLILEICQNKMNLDININDTGRTHVIGKARHGKSKVIARFISYRNQFLIQPTTTDHPQPNTTDHPQPNTTDHPETNTTDHQGPSPTQHHGPSPTQPPRTIPNQPPRTIPNPPPRTIPNPTPRTTPTQYHGPSPTQHHGPSPTHHHGPSYTTYLPQRAIPNPTPWTIPNPPPRTIPNPPPRTIPNPPPRTIPNPPPRTIPNPTPWTILYNPPPRSIPNPPPRTIPNPPLRTIPNPRPRTPSQPNTTDNPQPTTTDHPQPNTTDHPQPSPTHHHGPSPTQHQGSRFRFCGDLNCPDWVMAEIRTLSTVTSVKIKLLCVQVIKDLLDVGIDHDKVYKLTADAKFETGDVKASVAVLSFILCSAAKYNVDGESLSNELQQLGLPKEHATELTKSYSDSLEKFQAELRKHSLRCKEELFYTAYKYAIYLYYLDKTGFTTGNSRVAFFHP
ncbi:COMMD4 [Mytilus coruscus]|uniref:COMMD4 n=1 Tax=Mytilus coruscus TaxID=42192 RepID=A0A6J8AF41_MYTCO|nr:COMMD4 [Mytilus coruscus]